MRKVLFLFMLILSAASVSGCANTMQGVGQDVENAGKAIQDGF